MVCVLLFGTVVTEDVAVGAVNIVAATDGNAGDAKVVND